MNNLSKPIFKKDHCSWIYALAGLVLVLVKQPVSWIGWVILNLLLFQKILELMIIPHELGHAIAARLMGMKVIKIIIGFGGTLFTIQLLNMLWEFKQFLVGGRTLLRSTSVHLYRWKAFVIILFGPLTNFLLIFLALQFPQKVFLNHPQEIYLFPGIIFYLANASILVGNLFPYSTTIDGTKVCSDGLQLLTIPFLCKQEIARIVANSYVFDGEDWERRGNYAQAIENFNQLVEIEPHNSMSYLRRGVVYYNWRKIDLKKLQNAIEDFNQAIYLDPNIESFYFIRACSYYYSGDEMQAIEDFTKVIQLRSDTNSYYNRGVTYYQIKNYQAALSDFEQAINLNSQNVVAYYGRGNAKYELQDQTGALQDYKKAKFLSTTVTVNLNDEHTFYTRGIACIRLGDKVGAKKDLEAAEALCLKNGAMKLLQQIREQIKEIS